MADPSKGRRFSFYLQWFSRVGESKPYYLLTASVARYLGENGETGTAAVSRGSPPLIECEVLNFRSIKYWVTFFLKERDSIFIFLEPSKESEHLDQYPVREVSGFFVARTMQTLTNHLIFAINYPAILADQPKNGEQMKVKIVKNDVSRVWNFEEVRGKELEVIRIICHVLQWTHAITPAEWEEFTGRMKKEYGLSPAEIEVIGYDVDLAGFGKPGEIGFLWTVNVRELTPEEESANTAEPAEKKETTFGEKLRAIVWKIF